MTTARFLLLGFGCLLGLWFLTLLTFSIWGTELSEEHVTQLWLILGATLVVGAVTAIFVASSILKTESALRQEHESFKTTLASIGDAVIVIDDAERITFLNDTAKLLTGWEDDAVGRPLNDVFRAVHETTRSPEYPTRQTSTKGKSQVLLHGKDGRELPIACTVSPIHVHGRYCGVVLTFRDVSELRRAERRRNARLVISQALVQTATPVEAARAILEAMGQALSWDAGSLWIVNDHEQLLHCLEVWRQPTVTLTEFEDATRAMVLARGCGLPGRVWADGQPVWIVDVTKDDNFPRADVASREGLHAAFAFPILIGTNVLGVVEFFSKGIRQPDDDLLEMTRTIGNQLGLFLERKRAEEQLEQSARELADFFDNAPIGLHWIGPDGAIIRANRAELEFLGYSRDEYVGRHVAEFHADPDVAAEMLRRLKAGEILHEFPARVRRKDGAFKHVVVDSTSYWRDGKFVHTCCFTRDMTDRRRVEEEQKRALEVLAEADRRKDEFLAILSHELRNPLAPIRNALHVLRLSRLEDPNLVEARSVIERQVHQLSGIVDDLLDIFRITHQKLVLRKETIDLAEVVRVTAEDHRSGLEASRVAFTLVVPGEPVWIIGDRTRLVQVLSNLLYNAAKFTNPGDQVSVLVEVDHEEQRARVSVRDTGIGIASEILPHVFDNFAQAGNGERSRGGLGLGLTLVKGLIELHGGQVGASSAGLGHGTDLTFWLPLGVPPRKIAPASTAIAVMRPLRIAVVEDNQDTARTMQQLLTFHGHEVRLAHTGVEGLDLVRSWQPQVILCDLGLPEMDGFELAQHVRADAAIASTRLIAVSGYGQDQDRERSEQAGFDLHLTKPVDPMDLLRLLAVMKVGP
jgi:PAS domain S-box-containing protein